MQAPRNSLPYNTRIIRERYKEKKSKHAVVLKIDNEFHLPFDHLSGLIISLFDEVNLRPLIRHDRRSLTLVAAEVLSIGAATGPPDRVRGFGCDPQALLN